MRITVGRRFLVASLVALLSALIFKVSFFQENAEAYLFPSIVASVMLALSLLSLLRETFDLCVDDFQPFPFSRQIPVIVMMAALVLAVEELGIYTSAFLALALVTYWYSPQEDSKKRLISSLLFSIGFTSFMYVLFTVMLNVQLPRGILI